MKTPGGAGAEKGVRVVWLHRIYVWGLGMIMSSLFPSMGLGVEPRWRDAAYLAFFALGSVSTASEVREWVAERRRSTP